MLKSYVRCVEFSNIFEAGGDPRKFHEFYNGFEVYVEIYLWSFSPVVTIHTFLQVLKFQIKTTLFEQSHSKRAYVMWTVEIYHVFIICFQF